MTLFKNTVLKSLSLFAIFIDWLEIQATLLQAIQYMVCITKTK